jgi:hypothetical protein
MYPNEQSYILTVTVMQGIWESTRKGSSKKKVIVILYPSEQSYMPNDIMNVEKHIKLICCIHA